jgi:hypothetical protein
MRENEFTWGFAFGLFALVIGSIVLMIAAGFALAWLAEAVA